MLYLYLDKMYKNINMPLGLKKKKKKWARPESSGRT
jgi:hypothetical protein